MDQNNENNSSGIQFQDTDWQKSLMRRQTFEASKIVKLAMKLSGGRIKTEKQANYILLGFALIAIIVSFFLFFGGNSSAPPPPEKIINVAVPK